MFLAIVDDFSIAKLPSMEKAWLQLTKNFVKDTLHWLKRKKILMDGQRKSLRVFLVLKKINSYEGLPDNKHVEIKIKIKRTSSQL